MDQTDAMIDHLVLATPEVARTADELAADWGLALTPGGAHVGRGTRNELTGLGGTTYLEVVGPDEQQPDPPFPRPFGVDDLTDATLVAWCARPVRPLEEVVARCAALGIDLGPAADMSRARPDGVLLAWRLTMPLIGAPHDGTAPFLIDWLASPHPTASLPHECRLAMLQIAHPDADVLRAVLAEIGTSDALEVHSGPTSLRAEIDTPNGRRVLGVSR
jgi:hypothetical protein